ncbi:MAG: sporulation protein YqfD [Clostridiaceae bacterium]|nr:sporulation protein YqfD [Clostridiaceae bacterium]
MLLRLWNYLHGYVIIIVEGFFVEKFINICMHRQIKLWDIRAQRKGLMTMRMNVKSFKLIRPIARKARCKVRLLKKNGLPFVVNKYRRRKAFFVGAVLFFVLLYILTSFIWSVEITGNEKLQTSELEASLAQNGIGTGVLKYSIDTDRAVSNMMIGIEELSWISIVVRGTKVKVDVRERIEMPTIVPRHIPCDIVAVKDGIIKRIVATEGFEAAGEGDTVQRGQVLISGSIPLKDEKKEHRLVHAMGTVTARTWYEEEAPVILSQTQRIRTGKVINDHSLILFSWELDILQRKNKFADYTVIESRKKLSLGENMVFPIEWVSVKYIEEKLIEATINEEDAKGAAVQAAMEKLSEKIPDTAEIISKNVNYVSDDKKGLIAKVTIECIEDIGRSKQIGGN